MRAQLDSRRAWPRPLESRLRGCLLAMLSAAPFAVAPASEEPMRITITQAAGVYELPAPGEVALYSTPVQYEVLARETFSASALTLPRCWNGPWVLKCRAAVV